jgi:hypothetical protein
MENQPIVWHCHLVSLSSPVSGLPWVRIERNRNARGGEVGTRDVLVVVQKDDHSLGYFDFATGAELRRVLVPKYPHEFAFSADGRYAYSRHFGLKLAEDLFAAMVGNGDGGLDHSGVIREIVRRGPPPQGVA